MLFITMRQGSPHNKVEIQMIRRQHTKLYGNMTPGRQDRVKTNMVCLRDRKTSSIKSKVGQGKVEEMRLERDTEVISQRLLGPQ